MIRLFCILALLPALVVCAQFQAPEAKIDSAVNFSALQPGQQAVWAIVLDIPDKLHAQSHTPSNPSFIAFEIQPKEQAGVRFGASLYPLGHEQTYPALGKLHIYSGRVVTYVPLEISAAAGTLRLEAQVQYQLCDDKACYPPQDQTVTLEVPVATAGQMVQPNRPELFADFDPAVFARTTSAGPTVRLWGRELGDDAYLFAFFAALVIGVLFNVMPCVLPVVPLKAVGFYEVSQHNRAKSVLLGLVFSAGLVAVFAVLALLVVVLRKFAWGELYSNPWFLGAIILILLLLALSMFGVFNVGLPTFIYRFTPRHDTYGGNFAFGALTAVLSTPCTFGMFLGLLIWAARQPPVLGMVLVMTVGLGMALPYLLLSALPEVARRFPRTGPWAELVKQMMGFLLLASAVYFARRFVEGFIGGDAFWWMLFAVVLAAGVFLFVRTLRFSRSWVGPVVAALIALGFVAPALAFTWRITNPPIDWQPYSPAALEEARASGRPVLLEFTAAWCGNCIALETTVFHDPRTVAALKDKGVIALRADLTTAGAPGWELLRRLNPVGAIPLSAIYLPGRSEPVQLAGLYGTDDLLAALGR